MSSENVDGTDIAIVGMVARVPGADNVAEFWSNLRNGREAVSFLTTEQLRAAGVADDRAADPDYVPAAATMCGYAEFDAGVFGYSGREAAALDPQHRVFLEAAWSALEDAGYRAGAFDGSIGVYAAANMSTYLINNVLAGGSLEPGAETLDSVLANDKDYLASRVGYKLGLSGPALSVQTACSSSLVAVHLAAQALLLEECDMALAGGVALRFPQEVGYRHQEGLIFSADGHCRPFDAAATGTVAGNGVGVVVLKRLQDAVRDGDHVEAVLKGSAVNNDGSAKVGYTAPSVSGQAEVISSALAVAGVEPETVTALEAHGTGTLLGDPIEVSALQQVFAGPAAPPCALGSVKSNVGHLDSAAGVASLIKALLQLKHRELVPSINYDEPNPEIDFGAGRIAVNTETHPWLAEGPLRIGVSSFGMGGTNAHVVLEEAPAAAPSRHRHRAIQVLPLSAQNRWALEGTAGNLADALDDDRDGALALPNVAMTLQEGRARLPQRRFVAASNPAQTAEALRGNHPELTATSAVSTPGGQPRVVFMFPGQGSQYPGMARELYDSDQVFASCVDECAELFDPLLGIDLRQVLYRSDTEEAAEQLRRTVLAQPALFTVEYGLARTLQSWGVHPQAMVGHSIGELVAATLSGVFSLSDAARLVAARGSLMQQQPEGSMLSVATSVEQVRGMLGEEVTIAAVNTPELCVVSGTFEQVADHQRDLERAEIPTRVLKTSHAFHSFMMRPVLGPFVAEFSGITPQAPQIPFVSNRTGDWITAEQAADPGYWAGQITDSVLFAPAVEVLSTDSPAVLVEVGPGTTLSTFARQVAPAVSPVVSTLSGPTDPAPADQTLLVATGRMWLAGVEPDWEAVRGGPGRRLSLPTYPFQRRSYWIEPDRQATGASSPKVVIGDSEEEPEAGPDGLTVPVGLAPRPELSTEYVPTVSEIERRLVEIWQEELGVGPIGVSDQFLELGGHSLLATRLVGRVREAFDISVPLRELMASPTVRDLGEVVVRELGGDLAAAEDEETAYGSQPAVEFDRTGMPRVTPDPDNRYEPFPLSEIQQAQWIGRMGNFTGGNVPAFVYWEVDTDDVDPHLLESTFNELLDRHTMLCAVVGSDGMQRVLPDVGPYRFQTVDLSGLEATPQRHRLDEMTAELSNQTRPTDTWPLFDIRLTRLSECSYRIHLGFDLLIADIGSIRVLLRDWEKLYNGNRNLAPLELTYRDYVLASTALRESPLWLRARDYWQQRVTELPPAPDLPLAIAPERAADSTFTAYREIVPESHWSKLTAKAAEYGLTPSSVLLAVYAAVVGTWSRSGSFTLNVTVTNRLDVHDQVPDLVGEFASFDLLPVDLRRMPSIVDLGGRIQEQSWQDLEHRYFNGVDVLREMARRDGGTSGSTMPVVFTSTLVQQLDRGDDSMFGWLGDMVHESARTPQVWMDAGVLPASDGIQLSWHGVAKLFPEGVLEAMFEAFRAEVFRLATDAEAWHSPVTAMLPTGQRELIEAANDTDGHEPRDYLYMPLVAQAEAAPERTAVIGPDGTLTFGELYRRACALAHQLREEQVVPGELVAVLLDKGAAQVVAALAVQLAGAAYLPVDAGLPRQRIEHLLERGEVRIVLTGDGVLDSPEGRILLTVDLSSEPPDGPTGAPPASHTPEDLAYVIFTSGSTGEPKGVVLSHRAALNTLEDINERFEVGPQDRVLGLSSLSFDLSVWDIFGVLGAGGALVLPESSARRDPARWLELVRDQRVTLWNSVPALAQMFVEYLDTLGQDPVGVPLRRVLLSGDWIPVGLPERLRRLVPGARTASLGGATEAAVWSISYEVTEIDPTWDSIPYGRPLRNQRMYVLDDRLEPCPVWTTGELYIGGAGLAEGYWRDQERTEASFFVHPSTGERLYRTGDLGRWLPGGDIQFLGREDLQVKVGGFRIELGEIESVMLDQDGVDSAFASTTGDRHHQRLVGYLLPQDPESWDEQQRQRLVSETARLLERTLPEYMVPTTLLVLDKLPLTANGKVDRSALPQTGTEVDEESASGEITTEVARFAELIAEALGLDSVDPRQNFFEIGGDSIVGVQAVGRANTEGLEITLQDLFGAPTLADLAWRLSSGTVSAADGIPADVVPRRFDGGSVVCLAIDECVELDALRQAVAELVRRHPTLRSRLVAGTDGDWIVIDESMAENGHVSVVDLAHLPERQLEPALTEIAEEICSELDPRQGHVSALTVFELGVGKRALVWAVHQLAADTRSWEVLLTELFEFMRAFAAGTVPDPAATSDTFARWAASLPSEETEADPTGVGFTIAGPTPAESDVRSTGSLPASDTEALLEESRAAYRLAPREVLLAAAAEALAPEIGPEQCLGVLEDGRGLVPELDLSRSVGQFDRLRVRSIQLPGARGSEEFDPAVVLPGIKEQARSNYAVARRADCSTVLRDLGEFADRFAEHPMTRASWLPWPRWQTAAGVLSVPVLSTVIFDKQLYWEWSGPAEFEAEALRRLSLRFEAALQRYVEHCARPGTGAVTTGDFPLADLDDHQLETLLTTLNEE